MGNPARGASARLVLAGQTFGVRHPEVFVGVDVAKGDHYACAVTSAGAKVLARGVPNDEAAIGRLIDDAAAHGAVALVIDTISSAASLLIEAAAARRHFYAIVQHTKDRHS